MSNKQAEKENVYKKYSIRSEHALFVTEEKKSSNIWIEGKPWEFSYLQTYTKQGRVELQMLRKNSLKCDNMTAAETYLWNWWKWSANTASAAEIVLWYWNAKKEIVILHQEVYDDFSSSYLILYTYISLSVNKKFNVVIRLLDKREENDGNDSFLEPYYGDFGKLLEMVTLHIVGTKGETEASFTVPKVDLIRASDVFHRMFTAEMTEKATGEVKIEKTTAEEFGDFLKAISPKQEHPNPSNVCALLELADRYQCQLLRNRCETHLMNCIEIPLVERIDYADFYGLKDLKENLLLHLEETGLLGLYRDAKLHCDLHQAIEKLFE